MVMGYWSVVILFWQLSIDHIVNVQCKRCGLAKTRLRHPSLPFDSLPYPTRTICRRVRTYVRTLGQSRDNQTKRGWPYSMSMGLCPTRASPAIILKARIWTRSILLGRWAARALYQATQQCTLGRNLSKRCNILYYFWHTESHLNWKTVTHIRFITNIGAIPTKSGS